MIGFEPLASDSASQFLSLALPGAVWAILFYLAWEHPAFGESVGLGRTAFWLLLPGALLASFAILPLSPIANDWLAIDFAGAFLPLAIGGLALRRLPRPAGGTVTGYLAVVAAATGAMLAFVLPSTAGAVASFGRVLGAAGDGADVAVTLIGVAVAAAVGVRAALRPSAAAGRLAFLVGLTTSVLLLTFVASSSIPGVGITESFPFYLLPPVAAGAAASLLAPAVFRGAEGLALPTAFFATTVGVLVGADVLREPPLYGHGPPGLYVIGGAGIFDLVYLSGLIALLVAAIGHAAAGRGWAPVGEGVPTPASSPVERLRAAYLAGVRGDIPAALSGAREASHAAADRARTVLEIPPRPGSRPWDGLPVPGWLVADQANLDRVAASGTTDPREGFRAWLTARALVVVGREITLRRFASIGERLVAFALDVAIVVAPALLVFGWIVRRTPGGLGAVAVSVAFNTAIVGFVACATLYFAIAESVYGTTVGKFALGLTVRDRRAQAPGGLAALARNLPLAPMLTLVGIGAALALALIEKGVGASGSSLLGVAFPAGLVVGGALFATALAGVALLGSFGVVAMALTWERQRVGDLWAGTWVVRSVTPEATVEPTGTAVPPSG